MKIVRKSFTGEEKRKERKVETQKSFFFFFGALLRTNMRLYILFDLRLDLLKVKILVDIKFNIQNVYLKKVENCHSYFKDFHHFMENSQIFRH